MESEPRQGQIVSNRMYHLVFVRNRPNFNELHRHIFSDLSLDPFKKEYGFFGEPSEKKYSKEIRFYTFYCSKSDQSYL